VNRKREYIIAFVAGLIFAVGLALAGMTQPAKVISFFDFHNGLESWDPSLAFVLSAGLLVYVPVYRFVRARKAPLFDTKFRLPTRNDIDARLVIGSALFGIGWGLGGFCPGPALTSLTTGAVDVFVMVGCMLIGMALVQRIQLRA
jgi:uncharacterized membrane protein YedE/YeeE